MLSSQLTRTGLNSILVPGSEAVAKAIGPKAAAAIVNISRVGLKPIFGAAATKSLGKILRSNFIISTVSLIVFSVPDTVDLFRGRISVKQMMKNLSVSAGGMAGGIGGGAIGSTVGRAAGRAVGTAVGGAAGAAASGAIVGAAAGSTVPGVGTVIGGIVGGVIGGMGVSMGIDKISDMIVEDDVDEMQAILIMEFTNLAEEYMMNQAEADKAVLALQNKLENNGGLLKDMYAASDRNVYARNMIEPLVKTAISSRKRITLPDEDIVEKGMIDVLEEMNDIYEEAEKK